MLSKCIEFADCRFDGSVVRSKFIQQLSGHVDFILVCPELEIGLSVPRNPLRLVFTDNTLHLVQKNSGHNYNQAMHLFAADFCRQTAAVDGFILKSTSSTCGIKNVKIYSSPHKKASISSKGRGLFAMHIIDSFPDIPVEDEYRLTNHRIREHFLTAIFTLADFRAIRGGRDIQDLIHFQTKNNFLFTLYNQSLLRQMNRLAAHFDIMDTDELFNRYGLLLRSMFLKLPTFNSAANLLHYTLDYCRENLKEYQHRKFDMMIQDFKNKKVSLSSCIAFIHEWAKGTNDQYVLTQTFFNPYPSELVSQDDTEENHALEYTARV
ncbi:MAG: YbgA family protein [Spirochaetota bacterium]